MARQTIGSPHDDSGLNAINHNFVELYSYLKFIEDAKVQIDEFLLFEDIITKDMIQASAIGTRELADLSVSRGKIRDSAINTDKLGTAAVTWEKLGPGAVTNSRLQDNAV